MILDGDVRLAPADSLTLAVEDGGQVVRAWAPLITEELAEGLDSHVCREKGSHFAAHL